MAESLKIAPFKVFARTSLVMGAIAFSSASLAEVFQDPTRPPAAFLVTNSSNVAVTSAPILQSVIISKGRSVATINGQPLVVGDKYGDTTVVRITENEVVLRSGKDLQTLKLFPHIDRQVFAGKTVLKPAGIDR